MTDSALHLGLSDQVPGQQIPDGTATVVLPAEIDITNSGQVCGLLCAALTPGLKVLIADLTATTFCDVSGARAIAEARDRSAAVGTQLRLAVAPGRVHRVLDLLGLKDDAGAGRHVESRMPRRAGAESDRALADRLGLGEIEGLLAAG